MISKKKVIELKSQDPIKSSSQVKIKNAIKSGKIKTFPYPLKAVFTLECSSIIQIHLMIVKTSKYLKLVLTDFGYTINLYL